MLVSEIITRVRAIAGDVDVLQFTDADCYRWINDGQRECAIENDLLQVTASTAATANDYQYALPTDIAKLHSIKWDDVKLRMMTMAQFDEEISTDRTDTGTPVAAVIWANEIQLYPTPDAAGTLKVQYIKTPTEVTAGTDTPDIPVGYHRRLVDYCLAMVAEQDDDLQRYQLKMDEFRTGVQNLKDNHDDHMDLYPSIHTSTRDMGEGYFDYYGEY